MMSAPNFRSFSCFFWSAIAQFQVTSFIRVNNPFRLGAAKYAEFGEHTARGQLCSAEIARASVAGTPGAKIVEAVNSRGMSVSEFYFYGVVADGLGCARAGLRFV